ncbi:glutathione S-transferase [Podospora didyma]|uniref:Glutathione S-transferase n=1 Tax=Podospora didyma TaxID=330526 RepID=A0AAE0U856_9PEZI|nr:glutathione S-transferase [Podospora didyma]
MVLTIHHLHVSQSERIIWLCEELAVPYKLKTYTRAPLLAPAEYKALHPAGTSPVIQDERSSNDGSSSNNDNSNLLTLAESSACVEYIAHVHGGGSLFLSPAHPFYPDFLYWFHWANGTFQPALGRLLAASQSPTPPDSSNKMANFAKDRVSKAFAALDARLHDNDYLAGGDELTAADIMAVFPLTTFRYYYPYSLAPYKHILRYLDRIGSRDAYRRAMEIGDPDMELLLGAEVPPPLKN